MDSVALTLLLLCGPRGEAIDSHVRAEAHRQLIHPTILIMLIASESRCRLNVRGSKGEIGPMQLLPGGSAARGYTPEQLQDPAINIEAGARHLGRLLTMCNDDANAAISIYKSQVRKCRRTETAARVLRLLSDALEKRQS